MSTEEAISSRSAGMVEFTAGAALSSGQVISLPDGRAGVVAALQDLASGDKGTAYVEGRFEVNKAAIQIDQGDQVWWDATNNVATHEIDGDFYLGVCVEQDRVAGDARVIVEINRRPQYVVELPDGLWTTEATNGLGVTESYGESKLAFDAVIEAAQAALYSTPTIPLADKPVFEAIVGIFDIGDDAALDISIGLASASHATDMDAVAETALFHLDGNALDILAESDDGTTEVAATDTTKDAVDDTYLAMKIDARDLTDVKFYVNGVRVLSGTTFKLDAATGPVFPIVHIEKTSNDTTADVRARALRVRTQKTS